MLFKNNSQMNILLPPNTVFAPTEEVANRIDFLFFHYGNGLVFYFWNKAKNFILIKVQWTCYRCPRLYNCMTDKVMRSQEAQWQPCFDGNPHPNESPHNYGNPKCGSPLVF